MKVPLDIIALIASFVPFHIRIYKFSLLSSEVYSLIRRHELCSVDILEWDSSISNTFQTYNATLLRKEFPSRTRIHTQLLSQFRIKRINLVDSDKKNVFLLPFIDKLRHEVKSLGITWNPLEAFRDSATHIELEWFQNVRKVELVLRKSTIHNAIKFWSKFQGLKSLEELHIQLQIEDNTSLSCFVKDTPKEVLEKITHLRFSPREDTFQYLEAFPNLKSIRIPSFNRHYPPTFKTQVELNKELEVIIDVVHPWEYRLYEVAHHMYTFPTLCASNFQLRFNANFKNYMSKCTTFKQLIDELKDKVTDKDICAKFINQLEELKHIYTSQCFDVIWKDDSEKCFMSMIKFLRNYNMLEGIFPCVLQYITQCFPLKDNTTLTRYKQRCVYL